MFVRFFSEIKAFQSTRFIFAGATLGGKHSYKNLGRNFVETFTTVGAVYLVNVIKSSTRNSPRMAEGRPGGAGFAYLVSVNPAALPPAIRQPYRH